MWTMLAGVPGKLKTLLDRLTATRAANLDGLTATRTGYLDRLDATISSRAPASTALSSATWTAARAARLDAGVLVDGVVKSVQTGYVSPVSTRSPNGGDGQDRWFVDTAISAVNPARSVVFFQPGKYNDSTLVWGTTARLTSGTNLRVSNSGSISETGSIRFGGQWTVLEFY